jgi:hypothetical protein
MTAAAITEPVDDLAARESTRSWDLGELAIVVAIVGCVGFLLVRPWEAVPLPVADFGGWLTIFSAANSPAEGFRALVAEHAREGRVNPLSMAYVVLNWTLFEDHTLGWQMVRAAIMLGVIGTAYGLFRTLGAQRGGALVAAALFVVSDSARSVWLLPQAIEHVAALFVLLASLLAVSYQSTPRPWMRSLTVAALLILAVWVREPMVAAIPFVLLIALCHRGEGRFARPTLQRRSLILISVVAVGVLVMNVIPVIAVRFVELPAAYASRFGAENITPGNVANVFSALLLPVTREPLFPANAMFVLTVVVAAIGSGLSARRYRATLLLAATLPVCAAAIYVMWPSFPGNYALPYLPATALTFGLALTLLWQGSLMRRALAIAAASIVIGYGALLTLNGRREYAASRWLDVDMATFVSSVPASRLMVAVDDPQTSGRIAYGLSLYATATRGQAPQEGSDVSCGEAEGLVGGLPADMVVLRPPHTCRNARLAAPTRKLTRTTTMIDWKTLRPRPWEATADIWQAPRVR